MKLKLTQRRRWAVGIATAALLVATPSFALFGIGDIVFDPTSYASLVSQLSTIQMQYSTIKNNVTHFSTKQLWQTTLHTLENVNVANMFGETAGMSIALNTNSPTASDTAWKTATVPMNSSSTAYMQGHALGDARMSQLAMIETSDSISPDCLTAVGKYRSDRGVNSTANVSLSSNLLDNTDSTNSEVQQLNLLNASEAQKMGEMQSQGTLQMCLAAQMTVANMERRNAAAADLNSAALVQQQRAVNDTSAANESNTWQTYLP
jgi:hypothetical protein